MLRQPPGRDGRTNESYVFAGGVLRWINAIAEILSVDDVRRIVDIAGSNVQVYESTLAYKQLMILRVLTTSRLGTDDPWHVYDAWLETPPSEPAS
jgi:hypothetical protein